MGEFERAYKIDYSSNVGYGIMVNIVASRGSIPRIRICHSHHDFLDIAHLGGENVSSK